MRKFVGLLVGAALIACSGAGQDPNGTSGSGSDGSATLHANAHVVSQNLNDVVIVSATQLVYPGSAWGELGSFQPNDVILGDRQSPGTSGNNPEGYLRHVASISKQADGTVLVTTTPAALQEAVDSLKVQGTLQVPGLGLTGPVSQAANVHLQDLKGSTTIPLIDFSGTKLFDNSASVTVDGQSIGYHAFANVTTGTVSFSPSYDVGIDLGFLTINSFHATATGTLNASLLIDAGVQLTTTLDDKTFTDLVAKEIFGSPSATIADYTVNLGSLKVGPFNMPSSAHFTATLGCDFAWGGGVEVQVGGNASASVTAGVQYSGGTFSPIFNKSDNLTQVGPNWTVNGAVRAYCSIKPTFELHLFGMATGQIAANGYAGLGGSVVCGGADSSGNQLGLMHGDAEAGVSATVMAKVDILGLYKWQKSCTLFDDNVLWQEDATFVLPGGSSATCTLGGADYSLPPKPPVNPASCFGSSPPPPPPPPPPSTDGGESSDAGDASTGDSGLIPGTCTHDVCTAGEALGQACDSCTMAVCAKDPYCCDTYWGLSCFQDVQNYCGKTCN